MTRTEPTIEAMPRMKPGNGRISWRTVVWVIAALLFFAAAIASAVWTRAGAEGLVNLATAVLVLACVADLWESFERK